METILIVEDNKDMQFILSRILKDEGYGVFAVEDGTSAVKQVKTKNINLVLLDIKLPDLDGLQVLEKIKKINKDLLVILITAYADVKDSVQAMKLGAYDYITKPFEHDELVLTIKNALKTQYLSREVDRLRKQLGEKIAIEEAMGESPQIKKVLKQLNVVASTDMTVILQGESGTGKELIANLIHQKSPRKDQPFIVVDCGAIPETLVESELFGYEKGAFSGANSTKDGLFEQANKGTFFLDEICNLPMVAQAKILRVIQEKRVQHLGGTTYKKVDVRIIAATNINIMEAVKEGRFRSDLYHRLSEFTCILPPLRERSADIPFLAKHFLNQANQEFNTNRKGFSPDAMKFLLDYHWPGNVRELKNIIKRVVLLSDSATIKASHFMLDNSLSPPPNDFQKELEKDVSLKQMMKKSTHHVEAEIIKEALAKAGGNKTKAAKILKITRTTLYAKLKEFQLI